MKTSLKLIAATFTVAAIFLTSNLKAQLTPAKAFRVGVGLETAEPLGNYRLGTTFIVGGTIRLQYGLSDNFAITLTSGAYHFLPKYIPGTTTRYESFGVIPIKAGIKEFFVPNLYLGAEIGEALEIDDEGWGPKRLILSPTLGYANKHWDLSFRYEYFSANAGSNGLLGLRLAYGFGL